MIHDLGDEAINGEVDPLQYFLFAGMNYNLRFQKGHRIAISIAFEYSLNDLLKDEPEHLLFTYEGGHPFFTGIKVGFYL